MISKYALQFTSLILMVSLALSPAIEAGASAPASTNQAPQSINTWYSTYAVLSNELVTEGNPVTYTIDFHQAFTSISEVQYYFVFGDDPLDQWEWLDVTGDFPGAFGFINLNPTPQTTRGNTAPCSTRPERCDALMDGFSEGQLSISLWTGSGNPSIKITSLLIRVYGSTTIDVDIDIKPGSDTNPINPNSKGNIPVAILSTPDFDAPLMVDVSSLTFGRSGNENSLTFCNENGEDVNGDGMLDLVCHFDNQLTVLTHSKYRYGNLKGFTVDGTPLEGRDNITILN